MRNYIEIEKDLLPYQFNILLAAEWFELYLNYNETADLFTISVFKEDELITTEPLVFGVPLFVDTYQPPKFPAITLVPYDPNGLEQAVTYENLGETVFLSIDDEGVNEDEEL